MEAEAQAHIAFYLTGKRLNEHLEKIDGLGFTPALLARLRDLSETRYDYPIILNKISPKHKMAESLSEIVDQELKKILTEPNSERIQKIILQIEKEIRKKIQTKVTGSFSKICNSVANDKLSESDESTKEKIKSIFENISLDGELLDCDENLPTQLVRHLWEIAEKKKAGVFKRNINKYIVKLSDILKSYFERSEKGRTPEHLANAIGGTHGDLFDFTAMSSILTSSLPKDSFPESRRKRVSELLTVLKSQKFFSVTENTNEKTKKEFYDFVYDSCSEAIDAYRKRFPDAIELAKAFAIAELEIDGHYDPRKHDILFADYGANGLDPNELLLFPDYLISMNMSNLAANEYAKLVEILSSDLPIKILLQTDDILEEAKSNEGSLISGMRSKQLTSLALGLNEVYVLQCCNSNLVRFHESIFKGLSFTGPALFSIYSGANGKSSNIAPYIMSAAAMESRAFPSFTYDPSAGSNWATRFYLAENTQVELDWPTQQFKYEDEFHQQITEDIPFTFVDFIACYKRYAKHFSKILSKNEEGNIVPVDTFLQLEKKSLPDKIPFIKMVDKDNILHKVIVDERMIRETKRCREMWHSLQELSGIHNSHVEILLARERKIWEERMHKEAESQTSIIEATNVKLRESKPSNNLTTEVNENETRSRDEAYIDSPRCSACNACVTINGKMFAYNSDRQAYIANLSAGTYGQLVEAAETCQVAIIHPGKPINPNEEGLEELLERAETFR